MSSQADYRDFCRTNKGVPLFLQDWWLDAVSDEQNWEAVIVDDGEQVRGVWPYVRRTVLGMVQLGMPPLTQYLGPHLIYPDSEKYYRRLEFEKKTIQTLVDKMPHYHSLAQHVGPSLSNCLPLFWKGFQTDVRYTYRLASPLVVEETWGNLRGNIRREIRKAQNRLGLVVRDSSLEDFAALNQETFARQGMEVPYSWSLVEGLYKACGEKNCSKILLAVDSDGTAHAGAFLVWDHAYIYYLMGGADTALRNSGAMSLVIWEAIRFSAEMGLGFDFEGSMIEPVERFFRAFDARQVPYFKISHRPSRLIRSVRALNDIWKGS